MTTHTQLDHHKTKQTSSEFCGMPICVITSSVDGFITSKQIHYMFTLVSLAVCGWRNCRAVARQLIAMHSQPTFVCIYICPSRFGPLGAPRDSKWRLLLFCGRRFRSCSARTVIDMDKSTTSFLEERLTAAPRLVQFV